MEKFELGEIWKPYIPLKVSFFLWRLYNFLLPFPSQLIKMGVHGPFKCPFCAAQDSMLHCFWQCSEAKQIWFHFQQLLQFHPQNTTWQRFMQSWLLSNFKGSLKVVLTTTFYFVLWGIWKRRTACLYGDKLLSLRVVIQDIMQQVGYAIRVMKPYRLHPDDPILISSGLIESLDIQRSKQIQLVTWDFPPQLHFKLNCDGSTLGNPGPSGGGYVVINEHGKIFIAVQEAYGYGTNMEAEIKAMKHYILNCVQQGFDNFLVESDSKSLVDMVQGKCALPWKYLEDIHHIKSLITDHSLEISHIFREGNSVADYLAKAASTSQQTVHYDCSRLPGALGLLALRDNMQLPAIRA